MIRIFFIITIFLNISHADNYIEASEYENYLKNNIISRAQWKSYPCKPGMKKELKKTKFAIHHSASNSAPAYDIVKNIQHAHINDKKWSDIGYHFLIDIEGDEFSILNKENLKKLSRSRLIIEFHPTKDENKNTNFLNNLKSHFNLEILKTSGRDLSFYNELKNFDDIDR